MSLTFCRYCKTSTNVTNCCGRVTDTDENFERTARVVAGFPSLEKILSTPDVADDFHKLDRLADDIERIGWDVWRFEKAGEAERAKNLRFVIAAKEIEYKSLIAGRRNA